MEKNGLCAEADRRYLECFCRRSRDGLFVRYADPALPDMYCHNFLELRARIGDRLLRKTLEERLHAARAGGAVFFRLELGFDPAAAPEAFPEGGETEHNGSYLLLPHRAQVERWAFCPGCQVRQMTDPAEAAALAELDMTLDGSGCDRDFCVRRAERKTRVYISGGKCRNYLARLDGVTAGECTLFEHGETAKLEDLAVAPDLRHRKVASSLLRTLALQAMDDGCTALCLTADEDDTPKEMYTALGFRRVDERWAITWRLPRT